MSHLFVRLTAIGAFLLAARLGAAGRTDRFFVGTGFGAKRILGDSDEFEDAPFGYGSARFLIGVAF